ncbi:MAG: ATP-dependent helicase [Rubrivivax sp.]
MRQAHGLRAALERRRSAPSITTPRPALLVIAGAGSGKTATLAARAARAAIERGVSPSRLLLLTFSRRAAREMQRRVGRTLQHSLGLPLTSPAPQLPWCGTFHSVAARLLREAAPQIGLASGFTVLDRGDAEDLLGLARQELGVRRARQGALSVARHVSRAALARRQHRPAAGRDRRARLPMVRRRACRRSNSSSPPSPPPSARSTRSTTTTCCFARWHLMRDAPGRRAGRCALLDAVLVDEAQDINHLQADITQALRPRGSGLTLVGDDAQAIYGFRGAEVRHLLDFPARFGGDASPRRWRRSGRRCCCSNATTARRRRSSPR